MKLKMKSSVQSESNYDLLIDGQNTSIMSGNDYIWKDEKASFVVKSTSGLNNPKWDEYIPGFEGLIFSGSSMNQVWVDFHIDHDIALNTKIYPHVHWMPLLASTGTVRWGFQYIIAKAHGQSKFPVTSTTVYVDHNVTPNDVNRHMVSEVSEADAILSSEIEPDTVIKMRVFRAGNLDSYNGTVTAWTSDLHHQIARLGTKNKAPNFYA